MKYKGYDIEQVTESYLKPYGNYTINKGEKPIGYAKTIEHAKQVIDDDIWEDEKRFSDGDDQARSHLSNWDRDEIRNRGKSNFEF